MERKRGWRGIVLTLIGASCLGIAGLFGQYLFQTKGLSVRWLVSTRLVFAGLILLTAVTLRKKFSIWAVWKNKKDVLVLFLFGIFGMAACQFAFFSTVEAANAGTATVLESTALVWITIYMLMKERRKPTWTEVLTLLLAMGGTFLLATHGHVGYLVISGEALFWGITSSLAMAFYNLIPGNLMKKYGTFCIVGWGMLLGGIILSIFIKPWNVVGTWDRYTVFTFVMVIVVGTVMAFGLYLEGVHTIGAARASLFVPIESVAAMLGVVIWLNVTFLPIDFLGIAFVMGAVVLNSLIQIRKKTESQQKRGDSI